MINLFIQSLNFFNPECALPTTRPLQNEGARSTRNSTGWGASTQKPVGVGGARGKLTPEKCRAGEGSPEEEGTKVSPAGRQKIRLWVEEEKGNVSQRQ